MGNVNERECASAGLPPFPCPTHDDGEGPSSPVLVVIEETPYRPISVHQSPRLGDDPNHLETFELPQVTQEEQQMPLMDRHEQHLDHVVDTVDVFGDDSLLLSDSVIPASFEFVTEPSLVLSSGSDVFHTPGLSQLDIEGLQISADAPGSLPTLKSDVNTTKEIVTCSLAQLETTPNQGDLDSNETEADTTDSDFFEYISRNIHFDGPDSELQAHPPACIPLLDDPTNEPESGSKAPILMRYGLENTYPIIDELEARTRSEGTISKLAAPILAPTLATSEDPIVIQEESRHLVVSEPTAPQKLNHVFDVASRATTPGTKSVPDKVPRNLKSRTELPSSGPPHTAEKPNWALAPEDPPKPRITPRRKGERGHRARRGKQPDGDSSPESILPKSSKVGHNNRRRSKPINLLIAPAPPTQKTMGLIAAKNSPTIVNPCGNSSKGEVLRYLPLIPVTETKLSPSGKEKFKEGPPVLEMDRPTLNTNSSGGLQVGNRTSLEPIRESLLTQGSPTSVDMNKTLHSPSVLVDKVQKSDKQSSRHSLPWRSKLPLLTVAESAPNIVNDEFRKGSSTIPNQSSLLAETKLRCNDGENTGPATPVTKGVYRVVAETAIAKLHASNKRKKLEGSPPDNWDRFQLDSTSARGVKKAGRLSWPSSEEDRHKHHRTVQDREPSPWHNKTNNQDFSRRCIPPIPSAPLPAPRSNQLAAATTVEVSSFNVSKEILHPGTQNNSFHSEGPMVNLPSKPMHLQVALQDTTTPLSNDSTRFPLYSNIPIPTQTQNRPGSTQDDPHFQARFGAIGPTTVGLETLERSSIPGGLLLTRIPKLSLPGHVYRGASQTFIRQPEFQIGSSVPNPLPNTEQESSGFQYCSLAGHQPTPPIILPMPNDTSRPPVGPIARSRPDYPFPDLAYVHNYQVNRAYPQGPEPVYTGITQPPTTGLAGRLHRSSSLYGGWRERHGLGLSQRMSGMPLTQLDSHKTDPAAIFALHRFPSSER